MIFEKGDEFMNINYLYARGVKGIFSFPSDTKNDLSYTIIKDPMTDPFCSYWDDPHKFVIEDWVESCIKFFFND